MTVPPDERGEQGAGAPDATPAPDFDPYRFGAPEHPVPREYAPPGYRPPALPREPVRPQAPPPPAYSMAYPPVSAGSAAGTNGKAVTSMVLGIVSIVCCWLTVFDAVPVVLAVVFGIVALNEMRANPARSGRGMAIAGIVCGAVGAVLAIVVTTWLVNLANQCGGFGTNSADMRHCIQNHI
jgi:hypothetical protein